MSINNKANLSINDEHIDSEQTDGIIESKEKTNRITFEIVGTLDLRQTSETPSSESELGEYIMYAWWHTYLVKFDKISRLLELDDRFEIVDNIEYSGLWTIVKDVKAFESITDGRYLDKIKSTPKGTIINKGLTPNNPNVISVKSKFNPYMYIGLTPKRNRAVETINILEKISTRVYPLMTVYPTLKACVYVTDIK